MSGFSFTVVLSLYLFMLKLIISHNYGILNSTWRVWFETYHGAPDIIRSVLD
jgi:glycosylphosphatidylinositol transamidase (GPIT) subunit GPI8